MKNIKKINNIIASIMDIIISLGCVFIGYLFNHLGLNFLSIIISFLMFIVLVILQFKLFNRIKHNYGQNIKNIYLSQQNRNINVVKMTYKSKNTVNTYRGNNNLEYLFCKRKGSYVLAIHSSLFKGIIILKGSKLASHKHDRKSNKKLQSRAIKLRNKYQNKLNFLRRKNIIKNRIFIQNTLLNTLSGAAGVICQAPAEAKNTWYSITSPINIRRIKSHLKLNCDKAQRNN